MSGQNKWWVRDRAAAPVQPDAPEVDVAPDLETLTKAELVAMAEAKQLDSSGTKADIIERLSDG